MTDLEITKACAEAMGYDAHQWQTGGIVTGSDLPIALPSGLIRYDPLHDDAQAMALVKKFRLIISTYIDGSNDWLVEKEGADFSEGFTSHDLNRAICECVAKLQSGKRGKG